jgi:hypothetical protein
VKKLKKIMNNKKGIDTILAALLMVVIVVVASVMVYAWSTGLLGALMGGGTGNVGKEALIMEFSGFNSNYNVTMNLRNTGTASISLASYYVKDSTGNQWARLNWQTGPNVPGQISPNAVGIVYVTIGSGASPPQCGSGCTLTGTGFATFTSGYSYTVQVVTSRNTQFSFTVTR